MNELYFNSPYRNYFLKVWYIVNKLSKIGSQEYVELPWLLSGKESAWNSGDAASILGLGRSPVGGYGNPL